MRRVDQSGEHAEALRLTEFKRIRGPATRRCSPSPSDRTRIILVPPSTGPIMAPSCSRTNGQGNRRAAHRGLSLDVKRVVRSESGPRPCRREDGVQLMKPMPCWPRSSTKPGPSGSSEPKCAPIYQTSREAGTEIGDPAVRNRSADYLANSSPSSSRNLIYTAPKRESGAITQSSHPRESQPIANGHSSAQAYAAGAGHFYASLSTSQF